jgi:hypothetical protein
LLGEMAVYPAGSHIVAAVAAATFHTAAYRVALPVLAVCSAVQAGIVYNILLRVLPRERRHPLIAAVGTGLLLFPLARAAQSAIGPMFFGAFIGQGFFFSSVVAQAFVLIGLWALFLLIDGHVIPSVVLLALSAAALMLTWTLWAPVPLAAGVVLLLVLRGRPLRTRFVYCVALGLPATAAFAVYWFQNGTSGHGVLKNEGIIGVPIIHPVNVALCVLALIGLVANRRSAPLRLVLLVGGLGAAEYALLMALAVHGDLARYIANKMLYLLEFPVAIVAAIGLARLLPMQRLSFALRRPSLAIAAGIAVTPVVLVGAVRYTIRRSPTTLQVSTFQAAEWARTNLPPGCTGYLTQ